MIKITSRINPRMIWHIKLDPVYNPDQRVERSIPQTAAITKEEYNFIRDLNPEIYFNDQTCKHWCFDKKLPSGRWLENIYVEWRDNLIFTALIAC